MLKKGDTLIEVTLAVGIFSMIAIAVVAVMSGGTSGAQTALEATLARREIDTQAEAIRFIHSAFIADKDSNETRYKKLWEEIINNHIELDNNNAENEKKLRYTPNSCLELYNDPLTVQYGFIINPRKLSSFTEKTINEVFYKYDEQIFEEAQTYPHLVYGQEENQSSLASNMETSLFRAAGIYVIAVKDHETTNIVSDNNIVAGTSAFYDFYIRTCWYGTDADRPSAISTVIRLYDPAAIKNKSETNP